MSASSGRQRLHGAIRDLMVEWEHTRKEWQDEQAVSFEREYIDDLPRRVRAAAEAAETLSAILKKVRQDCDDR